MTPAQSDDINRELQATLQARRELGTTDYDEHFIEALVEKLRAEARAAQPQHRDVGPPSDQRLALAICSLVFAPSLSWPSPATTSSGSSSSARRLSASTSPSTGSAKPFSLVHSTHFMPGLPCYNGVGGSSVLARSCAGPCRRALPLRASSTCDE